ncbi:unnamed protein product, partial [Mesorhabditis belari]|uniref:C-type lectin domain-containing protein n=1 Tax=Mesorhabditis belari TaxID=2138241 RepID=A0AAF3J9C6_9BILA
MHRKLQIPFFLLTWIDFSLSSCPQGGIPGAIGGSCLFAVKFNASFENAQEFCSNYFGNLVSIRSSEENKKLLEVANLLPESTKFIWLGGTFDGAKITWIDGSTGGFSYLTYGSLAGNLLLNLTSGKWTTSNWNGMFPFVCLSQPQDPSNQPPNCSLYSPCPTDWVYSERLKFCYRVVFNVDFTTADQNCRLMGSQLASIHSEEENDFVNGKSAVYWASQMPELNLSLEEKERDPGKPIGCG